ncbi:MAG: dihydrolipoamide dehydrogenase [Coxiella sp. (in: Bacteria)]|nr:MAG: dihydrolipoamide dehydrogenase [Coxiella sp. (in: g-proteobacteria)]
MDQQTNYDFCVIGAGAGGLVVTYVAAKLGLKVALIENNKMGGDCLNYGCVPSKSLLSVAKHVDACRHLDVFGLQPCSPTVDYQKIAEYVQQVIKKIEPHDSVERFEGLGATVIKGSPQFISKNIIKVNDQEIKAKYIVIATGSRASVPPIPGLDSVPYLTNETIFDLTKAPTHLLVIGAGPIGVEMAQAQLMLGTPVTLLDMAAMLPKDDPDAVAIVRARMEKQGLVLKEKIAIDRVEQVDGVITLHYTENKEPKTVSGSHLLVAAGRVANVEGLELEKAGVDYDNHRIKVDSRLRTSNTRIYAIGDVSGGPQFTHVAGYQAGIVVRNAIFKMPAKVNYSALPWVTYTEPELAQVGMTELMAQQEKIEYKVTTMTLDDIDRYQAEAATEGFIKILTDKKGRVLGVTAVGQLAGELLLPWCLMIQNGLRLGKMTELIAPYPTRSEASKRVAGSYFDPILFTDRTRKVVKWLFKLF